MEAMTEIVATLTNQVAGLTDRLISAEQKRAEAQRDAAIAGARVQDLQERIEKAMTAHRTAEAANEATIVAKDVAHASEVGRLTRAADEATVALAKFRARPWWQRLAG